MSSPVKETASGDAGQVQFLLACIKHAENGRPDFGKVAEEVNIVSKGAAAKRYERLLKANGIPLPSQRGKDGAAPATPKKNKRKTTDEDDEDQSASPRKKNKTSPKKKKAKNDTEDGDEADEDGVKDEPED